METPSRRRYAHGGSLLSDQAERSPDCPEVALRPARYKSVSTGMGGIKMWGEISISTGMNKKNIVLLNAWPLVFISRHLKLELLKAISSFKLFCEYCFASLSAQSWRYRGRRETEVETMPYSYRMTFTNGFLLVPIESVAHSRPLNSLYMHTLDDKHPT